MSPALARGEQISKPLGSLIKPAPAPGRDSDAREPSSKVRQETHLQPRADRDAALSPSMFGFLQTSPGTPCIPRARVPEMRGRHPHVSPPHVIGSAVLLPAVPCSPTVILRLPFSTAPSSLPQPNTLGSRRYDSLRASPGEGMISESRHLTPGWQPRVAGVAPGACAPQKVPSLGSMLSASSPRVYSCNVLLPPAQSP